MLKSKFSFSVHVNICHRKYNYLITVSTYEAGRKREFFTTLMMISITIITCTTVFYLQINVESNDKMVDDMIDNNKWYKRADNRNTPCINKYLSINKELIHHQEGKDIYFLRTDNG